MNEPGRRGPLEGLAPAVAELLETLRGRSAGDAPSAPPFQG